jgi:hypothetical protein
MEKISISRNLLIGMASALALCVIALAFLLGRMSADRPAGFSGTGQGNPAMGVALSGDGADSPRVKGPPLYGPGTGSASGQVPGGGTGVAPLQPSSPGHGSFTNIPPGENTPVGASAPAAGLSDEATRTAVKEYFSTLDSIQEGRLTDNPQSFAQELISSALGGDTTGFDRIILQLESGRAKTRALSPPEPCADFHRKTLALIDESLQMMISLRGSIAKQDLADVATLGARAQQLKTRAESLDRQAREIKKRYGLAR